MLVAESFSCRQASDLQIEYTIGCEEDRNKARAIPIPHDAKRAKYPQTFG